MDFLKILQLTTEEMYLMPNGISFTVQFNNDSDVEQALKRFNQLERIDLKFILKCQRVTIASIDS